MELPEPNLFFGLLVDDHLSSYLLEVSQELYKMYVNKGNPYLQEISIENNLYLGKQADKDISLDGLLLLKANIISIIKKIIPEYPIQDNSLVLLGFIESE